MTKVRKDADVDACMRAACIEMGWVIAQRCHIAISRVVRTFVGLASRPQRVKNLEVSMIANTVSLSWRIGRAIALARKQSNIDQIGQVVVDAVGGAKTAKVLFNGKITDLRRRYAVNPPK